MNKLMLIVFLALAVAISGCAAAGENPASINQPQGSGDSGAGSPALNSGDLRWTASNHLPPGHFYLHLNAEQLQEKGIIPDLGFPVSATANRRPDGSILVIIVEELPNGNPTHPRTAIMIESHGFDFNYVFLGEEPINLDIHSVPVSAGVFDSGAPGIASFYATFEMDGISYSVSLPYYEAGDSGMDRLTEVVSTIIQNGPADLGALPSPTAA